MSKPQTGSKGEAAPSDIRFTMITAGPDGDLYALSESGSVYAYWGEQGWFRLAGDGLRTHEYEPDEGEEESEEDEGEEEG